MTRLFAGGLVARRLEVVLAVMVVSSCAMTRGGQTSMQVESLLMNHEPHARSTASSAMGSKRSCSQSTYALARSSSWATSSSSPATSQMYGGYVCNHAVIDSMDPSFGNEHQYIGSEARSFLTCTELR